MSRTWEFSELVAAVRKAAAERPDFVYQRRDLGPYDNVCAYTLPDGTPDCIIGVGLHAIGDPVPAWDVDRDYQGTEGRELAVFGTRMWVEYLRVETEQDRCAVRWLQEVQCFQDDGSSWSRAVREADLSYPLD